MAKIETVDGVDMKITLFLLRDQNFGERDLDHLYHQLAVANIMNKPEIKPQIKHTIQGMELRFPFNTQAKDAIKRLPSHLRKPVWVDGKFSHWLVANSEFNELVRICRFHLGTEPDVVGMPKQSTGTQTKLFKVKYIGASKDRDGNGNMTAYACDFSDNWNMVFSEDVLKDWFECGISGIQDKPKTAISTYYGLLGIAKNASGVDVKKAYRKAARRFHPDICKDDDAAEMFIKVQTAYEVLSSPLNRRKYDASLVFAADVGKKPSNDYLYVASQNYRPPQRCGWIMCQGKYEVGRFTVEKIIKWEPIVNNGQELVTSWDKYLQRISEQWVKI